MAKEVNQESLDLLGSIQPKGQADFTTDDIANYTPPDLTTDQMNTYRQSQQTPSTGALPNSTYYPDMGKQISVGGYSGSLIGSTTLFAPGGGVVPIGMMDARDLAVQKAAMQKSKEIEDFRKQFQAPTTKLTNIQPELSNQYIDYVQKSWQGALRKSGGDAKMATEYLKNDSNFVKKERAYQDLARNGNAIVEKIAQDEEEIKTGRFTPTPGYKEAKNKIMTALNPSHPEFQNLGNNFRKLQVERDFADSFNDVTKKMVADQAGIAYADIDSNPEFAKIYEETVSQWSPEQKEAVARTLEQNFYPGSDYWTPDRISQNVSGLMSGKQQKKNISLNQKHEADGAGYKYEDSDISQEPSSTNVYTKTTGGGSAQGEVVGDYGVTHKKPIKAIVPNGRTIYINDPEKGLIKTSEVNPNAATQLIKTQLVKVYDGPAKEHEGTPLSEEQIKSGRPWKWGVMTTGVTTEGTGEDKKETQFFIPAKEVENILVKKKDQKGAVINGVPIDKLQTEADKRNSSKKTGGTYTIKGKKYSLSALQEMGYNESQLSSYKDK
jgi:hypothetical protein